MDYTQKEKTLYIRLEGEIDHHNAMQLREKIDSAFNQANCRQMVFDFSDVEFMDSSGIGMIIGRYKNAKERGGTVSIAGMKGPISRIFHISGLAKIIDSYETVAEAENSLGKLGKLGEIK